MDKIWNLQALRAAAAGAVLVGHVLSEAQHHFDAEIALTALPWSRGVDLFFVISGVIVGLILVRGEQSPGAFLYRRLWRVVPLYYLFTTLMVGVVVLSPGALKDTGFDLGQIASSYAFFPYAREDGRIAPVLSLGWTLNYEVFFYGLAAFALLLRQSVLVLSAALVGLACLSLLPLTSTWAVTWTNPLILEFAAGLWLAWAYLAGWRLRRVWIWSGGGVAALVVLHDTALPRWLAAGGPAVVITGAFALGAPYAWPRWVLILGEASYALYLSHRFVLRPLTLMLVPVLPSTFWGIGLFACSAVGAALAVGVVVHLWVETPLRFRRLPQGMAA